MSDTLERCWVCQQPFAEGETAVFLTLEPPPPLRFVEGRALLARGAAFHERCRLTTDEARTAFAEALFPEYARQEPQ